jgi:hypothetical protein
MAANAYSITHVPTHQRGGPVTQAVVAMRQSERAPYEGRGCIVMDGQLVVFEAGRRPAPGHPALVVLQDGSLAVRPVEEAWTQPDPGFVFVASSEPLHRGVSSVRCKVALVGAVTG